MALSLAKIRADPYAQRLALLGETTITTAVSNVVTTPVVDLEGLQELIAQCTFVYGSAGIQADFFLQTSFDAGTTWQDIAAFRFPGVTGRLATDFDGSSDYYKRMSDLTGNADSKEVTFSAWLRLDGGDGDNQTLLRNTVARFLVSRNSSNKILMLARDSGGDIIANKTTSTTYTTDSSWLHVLISSDFANNVHQVYVNDNAIATSGVGLVDAEIDNTRNAWSIGANDNGDNPLNGAISELYFNTAEFLDISIEANRRKFISAAGHPVNLGADGSTPTGTQPIIYARDGDASNNLGSGGDFTAVGSPTSVPGPNIVETRFQAIKSVIATAANQSNQDGAMDPNAIIDGVMGDRLRVKYSTLGVFAGDTTVKMDAIIRG